MATTERHKYTAAYLRILTVCLLIFFATFIFGRDHSTEIPVEIKTPKDTPLTVERWLQQQNQLKLKDTFAKAGILGKELISLSIKDIETIKEVPDKLKQDLKAFITNAKDTEHAERFVIWLTAQRLPLNLIERLTQEGINDFSKLSQLRNAEIAELCTSCNIEDFQQLKHLVKSAQSLTADSLDTSGWSGWSWFFFFIKLVLTLGLGIAVLCVVIVMDCIRNIALDLRHIRIPGASGTVTSVPASGDGKNWLWKLLFNNSALSLASQFCVVKWHWEEPQVVGNTMSFTVKRYDFCAFKE